MESLRKLISENRIIQAIIFALSLAAIYYFRTLAAIIIFSYILMAGIVPFSEKLKRSGFPGILAIAMPYAALLSLLVLIFYLAVPSVLSGVASIAENLPEYVADISENLGNSLPFPASSVIEPAVSAAVSFVRETLITLPETIIGAISVIAISIYFLSDRDHVNSILSKSLSFLTGEKSAAARGAKKVEHSLGRWLHGQILLAAIVGAMTWIGLSLLGVPSAGTLAFLTALLEAVPYLGPIISGAVAAIVASSSSLASAAAVLALYVVIQQIEGNILTPLIIGQSVELRPAVVIIAILAGAQFMGIIGAILAVPIVTVSKMAMRNGAGLSSP